MSIISTGSSNSTNVACNQFSQRVLVAAIFGTIFVAMFMMYQLCPTENQFWNSFIVFVTLGMITGALIFISYNVFKRRQRLIANDIVNAVV